MKTVIVIGGGASGMMAAGTAAARGHKVYLIEKNRKLGRKLAITGKGRCNITNQRDVEGLLDNIPGNPYFLYSAFYAMNAEDLIQFFRKIHLETKVERGNRVFPISDRASDVVGALERFLRKNDVEILCQTTVRKVLRDGDQVCGVVTTTGQKLKADAVIVATGGLSYPRTGSTGDGYRFARQAGHFVTELHPSLVPLHIEEEAAKQLQGLSLKNVVLSVMLKQKKIFENFGEMLFTHEGVSGPLVLTASRYISDQLDQKPILRIDLKPTLDQKALSQRLLRDFTQVQNKQFKNSLDQLLPQKMIPVILDLSGIPLEKRVHDITKKERKDLIDAIKGLSYTVRSSAGFSEAVVTKGGVSVDEISPGTMESKLVKSLYFVGETLDVDGLTGGFNLQIAFSTGFVAGSSV